MRSNRFSVETTTACLRLLLALVAALGCGCATTESSAVRDWHPVNALASAPQPLSPGPQVRFISTPVDDSLRTLLSRWARESDASLEYRIATDYSLSVDAASIRATSIHAALEALNRIYAAHGLVIGTAGDVITVGTTAPDIDPTPRAPGRHPTARARP